MQATLWTWMSDQWRLPPPSLIGHDDSDGESESGGEAVDRAGMVALVEDDVMVREVLTEALRGAGHRVIACRDSEECLRALPRAGQRVVLVTDMMLPGSSGRALADEFRRRHPGQPVIFVTGLPADAVGTLHADEIVLLKPFRMCQITAAIAQALATGAGSA